MFFSDLMELSSDSWPFPWHWIVPPQHHKITVYTPLAGPSGRKVFCLHHINTWTHTQVYECPKQRCVVSATCSYASSRLWRNVRMNNQQNLFVLKQKRIPLLYYLLTHMFRFSCAGNVAWELTLGPDTVSDQNSLFTLYLSKGFFCAFVYLSGSS